jgi:hypothetical protein
MFTFSLAEFEATIAIPVPICPAPTTPMVEMFLLKKANIYVGG